MQKDLSFPPFFCFIPPSGNIEQLQFAHLPTVSGSTKGNGGFHGDISRHQYATVYETYWAA